MIKEDLDLNDHWRVQNPETTRGPRAWRSADRKQTRNRILKYVYVFLILNHSRFVVEYHNFQNRAW
jgi:hypothetical protein